MEQDLEKYVFYYEGNGIPESDLTTGVGVLVGHYFITAGHVVAGDKPAQVTISRKTFNLHKSSALVFNYNGKMENGDIAVFKFDDVSSTLTLANQMPEIGQELKSISYLHATHCDNKPGIPALFNHSESLSVQTCNVVVDKYHGDFFSGKTSILLYPGTSGSPVFKGSEVAGILTGGMPDTDLCVFYSAQAITRLIEKAKRL